VVQWEFGHKIGDWVYRRFLPEYSSRRRLAESGVISVSCILKGVFGMFCWFCER